MKWHIRNGRNARRQRSALLAKQPAEIKRRDDLQTADSGSCGAEACLL